MLNLQPASLQAAPKNYCLRTERPATSPQSAAAVVEAWLSDALVSLPFDQDPGTAERFTELWAKAFKEVWRLMCHHAEPRMVSRLCALRLQDLMWV